MLLEFQNGIAFVLCKHMFYVTPCDFMCDAFFEKLKSQANAQIKHSGDVEHAEHMCRNNHLKFDAIGIFYALGTSATAWRSDFANICFCLAAGDSCSTRFGTFKQSNKYTNLTLAGDLEPTENCVTQQLDTRCDGNTRERLVRLWIIGFGKAFVQNTARRHTLYHRSSVALLVPFVASVGSSHTPTRLVIHDSKISATPHATKTIWSIPDSQPNIQSE